MEVGNAIIKNYKACNLQVIKIGARCTEWPEGARQTRCILYCRRGCCSAGPRARAMEATVQRRAGSQTAPRSETGLLGRDGAPGDGSFACFLPPPAGLSGAFPGSLGAGAGAARGRGDSADARQGRAHRDAVPGGGNAGADGQKRRAGAGFVDRGQVFGAPSGCSRPLVWGWALAGIWVRFRASFLPAPPPGRRPRGAYKAAGRWAPGTAASPARELMAQRDARSRWPGRPRQTMIAAARGVAAVPGPGIVSVNATGKGPCREFAMPQG